MEIKSSRTLEELKSVLQNPDANGPNVVYWVFKDITQSTWANMTVTVAGRYDKEYPKTYGHYHTSSEADEVYRLIHGRGIFLLQKKHIDENGNFVPDIVDEVYVIQADTPDEEIVVPKEYGHSWSNIGDTPLITFDNWIYDHNPADYKPIEKLKGLVYYVVENNGNVELIPNPNYKKHPKPIWVTPKEFAERTLITSII